MSIDRCKKCGDLVDTDNEPEAYVQIGNMRSSEEWICLCRRHREEREDQREPPANLDQMIQDHIDAEPRYSCKECDWDVDGCVPCEKHNEA